MSFPHLPVTDFPGCTQNFERLLPLLDASESSATRRGSRSGVGEWVALTLGPKIEAFAGFQTLAARIEGASVRLRGVGKVKAASELKAGETFATIPEGSRPPETVAIAAETAGVFSVLTITTAGVITSSANAAATTGISLDSLTYNLN
jgi:hypothetical protein